MAGELVHAFVSRWQYTVFGKVLAGDDVLAKLEEVETKKQVCSFAPRHMRTARTVDACASLPRCT